MVVEHQEPTKTDSGQRQSGVGLLGGLDDNGGHLFTPGSGFGFNDN